MTLFAGEPPVNVTPESPRSVEPDIALNSRGDFGVAYIDWSTTQYDKDILVRLFYSNDTAKGDPIIVTGATSNRYDPRIIFNSGDGFSVFWIDLRADPVHGSINCRQFDCDGNAISKDSVVVSDLNWPGHLNMAQSSTEQAVLTWANERTANTTKCYFQIIDRGKSPVGDPREVSDDPGWQLNPDIAIDSNNDFIIVWEYLSDFPSQIYFQKFNTTGMRLGAPVRVCPSTSNQTDPSITFDSHGNFMIAWTDNYNVGVQNDQVFIHAQLFRPDGQRFGGEINISKAPDWLFAPDVTVDSKDNYIVVGEQSFQRLDNNGTLLGDAYPVIEEGMHVGLPKVARTGDEDFLVTWSAYGALNNNPSKSYVYVSHFKRGAYSPFGAIITPEFRPEHLVNWTTINASFTLPNPSANSVSLFYSLDNGTTWVPVQPGQNLSRIPADKGSIRLMAELRTLNRRSSPILHSLSLDYTINRPPYIVSLEPSDLRNATRLQTITMTAVAEDPDGDRLGFSWGQTAGPPILLMDNGTEAPSFIPSETGFYQFELKVRDARLISGPAYANITVVNLPPEVRIWTEGAPVKNSTVRILTDCWDPEDDPLTFGWNLSEAPTGARLDASGVNTAKLFSPVPGQCSVIFRVDDSEGVSVTKTLNITFYGRDPIAIIAANRTSARPEGDFGFSATGSSDPDNDTLQYHFDFGDGNSTGWTDSPLATHSYPVPGKYSVNLTVRDTDGNISRPATLNLTVLPPNAPPRASFIVVQGNLTTPFQLTSTSIDPDGTISALRWDFGDGTGGTGASVTHLYASGGGFNVTLTVTDNEEVSSTCVTAIRINRPPEILSFSPNGDSSIRVNSILDFSISVTDPDGDALTVKWLADGKEISGEAGFRLSHMFRAPGAYKITVTVEDGHGGTASHEWNVTAGAVTPGKTIVVDTASMLPWIIVGMIVAVMITLAWIRYRRLTNGRT